MQRGLAWRRRAGDQELAQHTVVHCVCTTAVLCFLLAGLGDVRLHVQVDPSSCGSVVELDRLSIGQGQRYSAQKGSKGSVR